MRYFVHYTRPTDEHRPRELILCAKQGTENVCPYGQDFRVSGIASGASSTS